MKRMQGPGGGSPRAGVSDAMKVSVNVHSYESPSLLLTFEKEHSITLYPSRIHQTKIMEDRRD